MHVPDLYRPPSLAAQQQIMRAYPFATLIAGGGRDLRAVDVPTVFDPQPEPNGRLRVHMAKSNSVVGALRAGGGGLALFKGPHAYICPDDYASEPHFPTWNYIAVHAHVTARPLDDADVRRQLDDLIAQEEARLPKAPWTLARAPVELFDHYFRMITGFELTIDRLEAIFKLGQNKEPADLVTQVVALRQRGESPEALVAAAIEAANELSVVPEAQR
jgi:transcriptional regulator